jgi:hypothetical protein
VQSKRSQQIDEPTQIVAPEMCPARANPRDRVSGDEIRPLARESGERSSIVVKEDPVLAQRLPAFD